MLICAVFFFVTTSFKKLSCSVFETMSSFQEVAFETFGAAALVCILIADECETEIPRPAHRCRVSAFAPPFNNNKRILWWAALICWLYWCKQMEAAMQTEFWNWLVISASLKSGRFPFKFPGCDTRERRTAKSGHLTSNCWLNDSFQNLLMSAGLFSFNRHAGSLEYNLISFLISLVISVRIRSLSSWSFRTAFAKAELLPHATFFTTLLVVLFSTVYSVIFSDTG